MDAILFNNFYDPARLRDDLESAAAEAAWIIKPERGKYKDWSALPLHALRGETTPAAVDRHVVPTPGECSLTPIGRACPYVREILDGLPAEKLRVRFMRLAPGGRIGRHRDRHYGWTLPILRLHVPVLTGPAVEFLLADRRITMQPGELWYLDFTRDHEVYNGGTTDRVHLVIDMINSEELRAALGPSSWAHSYPAEDCSH